MEFAAANPAVFKLLFSDRGRLPTHRAAEATFAVLVDCVTDAHDRGALRPRVTVDDVVPAAWSLVHGLATLHLDGALEPVGLGASLSGAARATVRLFVDGLRGGDPPTGGQTTPAAATGAARSASAGSTASTS